MSIARQLAKGIVALVAGISAAYFVTRPYLGAKRLAPGTQSQAAAPGSAVSKETPSDREIVRFASKGYPKGTWRLAAIDLRSVVIAGSHIAISFRNAELTVNGYPFRIRRADRTEAEAAKLAMRLTRQLLDKPELFGEVAKSYSDDLPTSSYGGRIGLLRGDQVPDTFLDAFATLEPGQVAQLVVRSAAGFHILRRDALPEREWMEVSRIVVRCPSTGASGVPRTREAAIARATEALAQLSAGKRFRAVQAEFSDQVDSERNGRVEPTDSYARSTFPLRAMLVSDLRVGAPSGIVETDEGFEIWLRQGSDDLSTKGRTVEKVLDLPNPPRATLQDYVLLMEGDALARYTRGLTDHLLQVVPLSALERSVVRVSFDRLAHDFESEPEGERSALQAELQRHLREGLSPLALERVNRETQSWFVSKITQINVVGTQPVDPGPN